MRTIVGFVFTTLLLCTLFYAEPLTAQQGSGTVMGTAKDSAGSTLQGALVELLPVGKKAVTDELGQFRITSVAPGEYTLSVSYVGFQVSNKQVTLEAGKTETVEVVLQVASQVDQVLVTGERLQGEAEAINITRTSDDIVQVLPEKVITSLPNTNVADAVGRLPSVSLERDEGEGKYVQIRGTEPRLNNTMINGVNVPSVEGTVRNVKLDAVPANIVERIEVFKTLSASQDADGIGGTVNLVTKTAGEKATYNFGGEGGYTPIQNGRWLGGFDGTVGKRLGSEKKLGILVSGTFDRNDRGINDLEPTQTALPAAQSPNGKNIAFVNGEDLRTYAYYRTRFGFAGGIDYNLKPGTNLYLKGLFSDFHDFGDTWVYTPNAGALVAVNGSQFIFDNTGSYQYRHYIRRPDQQLFSILTGARQDLTNTLIVYEFAGSRGHNIGGQDFPTTNFNGNSAALQLSLSDPYRPKFTALDGSNLYDPTQYTVSKTIFPIYHATQVNFQGAISAQRRYKLSSHYGTFEMGLKIRDSHTTQNEHDSIYTPTSSTGPFTLSQVLGNYTNNGYYDGTFRIGSLGYGPTSDYGKIQQALAGTLNQFQYQQLASVQKSEGAFFNADERIYAGYLMNTISLGKFRVQTGVRFEGTDTNFTTHHVDATQIDSQGNPLVTPFSQSSGYFEALPSVQVQYLIEKNTTIRGNYSMGISRPNIGDLVPTTIIDPNASPKSVTLGNSNLQPTKANNFDVLVEHFFQPLGVLQAGFFYKRLSDPIYPTAVSISGGPLDGYLQTQSINGPNAHIAGFETAWEQRFSFLPGLASGFGVAANYSYTTSQATFPANFSNGRNDQPALQRQAPNNWNFGLTYDKARFSMRFAISHNDSSIFQYAYQQNSTPTDPILGLKGPGGDIYLYAHTQFDVQGSYRLHKGLSVFAYGLNLSNEVFGFYQGSGIYPIQREYYHPTAALGLRWTSSSE
jgi:TonB-dependent receptor